MFGYPNDPTVKEMNEFYWFRKFLKRRGNLCRMVFVEQIMSNRQKRKKQFNKRRTYSEWMDVYKDVGECIQTGMVYCQYVNNLVKASDDESEELYDQIVKWNWRLYGSIESQQLKHPDFLQFMRILAFKPRYAGSESFIASYISCEEDLWNTVVGEDEDDRVKETIVDMTESWILRVDECIQEYDKSKVIGLQAEVRQ